MISPIRTISIFLTVWFPLLAHAGESVLAAGDTFPVITAQDQHEKPIAIEKGVRHVMVTFSMGVGKKANKYFAGKGAGFLPQNNAILVNDIHPMPGVGRVFALPKMRKYPHRILLADEEGLLDPFPQKDDMVTVFDLDADMRITAIRFWDPESGEEPLVSP